MVILKESINVHEKKLPHGNNAHSTECFSVWQHICTKFHQYLMLILFYVWVGLVFV